MDSSGTFGWPLFLAKLHELAPPVSFSFDVLPLFHVHVFDLVMFIHVLSHFPL